MSKAKKKGAASEASASQSVPSLECEVFASRLWTVTNGGALLLPVASPPPVRLRAWAHTGRWCTVATVVAHPTNKVREL